MNDRKDNVVCCGIQLECDESKQNMMKKAEKYIKEAVDSLHERGEEPDIIVLPEQFVQVPETADKYGEEYGISKTRNIAESVIGNRKTAKNGNIAENRNAPGDCNIAENRNTPGDGNIAGNENTARNGNISENGNAAKNEKITANRNTTENGNITENENTSTDEMLEWTSYVAKEFKANVVAGTYPCVAEDGKIYNRCLTADRDGRIIGKYDKIHLFDAFNIKESDTFAPGNELGVFDTDVGKIGIWICYDSRFPEISRALRARGADILIVPAAFYKPNYRHWDVLTSAAAIMNVTPVIAVNQCGSSFVGNSAVYDAYGDALTHMGESEGYMTAVIDMRHTEECRKNNPEYENRRFDLYRNWL